MSSDLRNDWKGYGQLYAKDLRRDTVVDAREALKAELEKFKIAVDADLAAVLQAELLEIVRRYEDTKQRSGFLDFLDLLVRARDLIRDCESVRADFQNRFTHIFVDEFQDTDPLQAEILLLLASKDRTVSDWRKIDPVAGKLFIVGDPKQSIYRFRRADVGIYLQVKEILELRGAKIVQLTTSFRSVPSIQNAVNTAFEPVMQADAATLQASYVPLSPYRKDIADQPTVITLPVPEPYGRTRVTKGAIEASLPDAVAAFVQWLLYESGWSVTEREDHEKRVPVAARHVCLLFRRFESFFTGDVTRGYAQALEARGIPHLLVGGRSFHIREEIETMRAALSAIEWPDDELSVFATLHGSLFAIGDAELLQYRHRHGRLHPFRCPKEEIAEPLRPIVSALRLLADLHRGRNYRPVSDTIARLLEETRAAAGFVLRPSGEQALANVLHVGELARAYEQTGGLSFRAFVDQLMADAERGQSPEALILEEGSDGVRIMTTHKAKGLEFPVVILADITTNPTGGASRYVDSEKNLAALRIAGWSPSELLEHANSEDKRDEAEALRLAYVAATRARDLLVIPSVGDGPFENGWVSCLNRSIYPQKSTWQKAKRAPASPKFGNDSVLDRRSNAEPDEGSVQPGLHPFTQPDYNVVWWDPKALALKVQRQFGIRQEELLGKKTAPAIVEKDLQRYRDWDTSRGQAIAAGARQSMTVITATQQARDESLSLPDVEVIEVPRNKDQPGGKRFGALVHAMLATVPLRAERDEIERAAELPSRILGALPEECSAAVDVVAAALAHPLLRQAAEAADRGECRRETPVTLRQDEGTLVEGTIDLAFKVTEEWRVIDFKTDRELNRAGNVYRRQVALYAEAVRVSTGAKVTCTLLRL
ncbi:MAG: UvrD-helicase domain-containing protein [Gammaproteobacteria bacterium]